VSDEDEEMAQKRRIERLADFKRKRQLQPVQHAESNKRARMQQRPVILPTVDDADSEEEIDGFYII
jgi:hypothetical protein